MSQILTQNKRGAIMLKSNRTSKKNLKIKTNVKAGGGNHRWANGWLNHNETQVRKPKNPETLKVKTNVKAGGGNSRYAIIWMNHNETQVREPKKIKTLKVKTNVKAGLRGAPRYVNGWLGGIL